METAAVPVHAEVTLAARIMRAAESSGAFATEMLEAEPSLAAPQMASTIFGRAKAPAYFTHLSFLFEILLGTLHGGFF